MRRIVLERGPRGPAELSWGLSEVPKISASRLTFRELAFSGTQETYVPRLSLSFLFSVRSSLCLVDESLRLTFIYHSVFVPAVQKRESPDRETNR